MIILQSLALQKKLTANPQIILKTYNLRIAVIFTLPVLLSRLLRMEFLFFNSYAKVAEEVILVSSNLEIGQLLSAFETNS